MKRLVWLICGVLLFVFTWAQSPTLSISRGKTTTLIFPFAIRHVDRGTKDVLVQSIKEADSILLIKAAIDNFSETNLSVITDDGSVYSFVVNFDNNPPASIYHLPVNSKETVATCAHNLLDNPRTTHGIRDKNWDMLAMVSGIYIKGDVMFYQMRMVNETPIDYDIELLRFFIRDKKKGKRTAIQENELKPLYIVGNTSRVKGNSENNIVVALEKFTIPDAKYLAIQIMEKNGGRHLQMKVRNNKIIKAIPLSDLK